MLMKIEGAVVLITGANRGLGLQFAKEVLARGAKKVYAAARDPSKIGLAGVVPIKLDVTNAADVAAVAEQCADVTLLINNAGIVRVGGVTKAGSAALLREQLETNLFGILGMGEAFADILGSNGGGAMLNILSILSWVNTPYIAGYGVSKAAAWALTNSQRHELRAQGTQVVAFQRNADNRFLQQSQQRQSAEGRRRNQTDEMRCRSSRHLHEINCRFRP
jgi:NAD(P)-dependent dehydrogenase (short-subunit alcohol dehydrogenase family)